LVNCWAEKGFIKSFLNGKAASAIINGDKVLSVPGNVIGSGKSKLPIMREFIKKVVRKINLN
jgi:hypothetical protein